jgi:hypothetical protein
MIYILSRVCGDNIRWVLDWQLDILDTLTITLNYSVYTLQLTVHYTRAESSHLCLHWLPVFQHRRTCSPSEPTATASLTELPVLCSVTHLYSTGTWLRLLLRHSRNTSRDVYRAAAARASAILFAASHSTVAWLPSNCCKQRPYCLQHARHNTKFNDDWFGHSKVDRGDSQSYVYRQLDDLMSLLLFFKIRNVV